MSNSLRPHGLQLARLLCPWGFSRPEYWSGLPCPPPGDLPDPGIEPRSPALQADSLLTEPPGKPENTGVDSLICLKGIFPTQESNCSPLHCRQILYQLSYQGSPSTSLMFTNIFLLTWVYNKHLKLSTADPWTTWVWTAQVYLSVNFFQFSDHQSNEVWGKVCVRLETEIENMCLRN